MLFVVKITNAIVNLHKSYCLFLTMFRLATKKDLMCSFSLTKTAFVVIIYWKSNQKIQLCGVIDMFVKDVKVQNQVGLHARPATFFIQKANEFKSSIWVEKEERRVNAKSLLGVLSLGIMGGTDIRIIAGGTDEEQAVEELVKLVESGFAE